jgi:hypothetical protein
VSVENSLSARRREPNHSPPQETEPRPLCRCRPPGLDFKNPVCPPLRVGPVAVAGFPSERFPSYHLQVRHTPTGASLILMLIQGHIDDLRRSTGREPRVVRLPREDEQTMRDHADDRLLGVDGSALATVGSREEWQDFLRDFFAGRYRVAVQFNALGLLVE